MLIELYITGEDPGFQVRGGGALKKIGPSGGRREICWGISCEKITILRQKIIFLPILGGRPPWIRPCISISTFYLTYLLDFSSRHSSDRMVI